MAFTMFKGQRITARTAEGICEASHRFMHTILLMIVEAIDVERIVPNMETILTRYFDEEIFSNYEQVDVFLLGLV